MTIPSNKNWQELNAYKASLKLTQQQKEILIGGLLGDLSLRKIGKYSRLVLEQKNKDYLYHLYEIFKPFVRTPPQERLQKRLKTSEWKSSWYFSTISHPEFEYFYNIFYVSRKKIVPLNIKEILTAQGLAYWFMDDGSRSYPGYSFSTASFSEQEHKILVDVFLSKFNINCNIHHGKYQKLYIPAQNESNLKFLKLIEPYIVESMKYKL